MKKIKTFALFMLLALCVTIPAAVASADEVAATSIVGHNLALEDNIEIVYIVEETAPQGAETGVLFWLSPQEEYVYGEQEYKITTPFGTVVNPNTGNTCQKYAFNYLSAKQMTENVYAVSFIKDGENITYSGVDKYSILQYAYNKKNSETILDGGTASLGEMLSAMLDYGAITQQYFGYNTERLANATYYRVSVNGGALSDGLTHGLYKNGETVTVIAGEPELGKQFKQWVDEDENALSTESEYEFTIENDLSLTAIYEEKATEGLAYTLNNGGNSYYVSGIGTATDTEIFIPSTYNYLPVTSIGISAFENCSSLTSITIPDSVTSIGNKAFNKCSSLTSITFGENSQLISIENYAFQNCKLTSITIPDSVISIGDGAFANCTSLTSVTIGNSVTIIGSGAFQMCSKLTSITIGNSVTIIGWEAFYKCSNLTNISIPDSVTNIEKAAFSNCSSLTSITIPDSVTNIGNKAFYYCNNLTSITFGEESKLISIGTETFSNCSSLTSITIPDSVTSIGNKAFYYCSGLTSVTIGNSVTSIGDYAFAGETFVSMSLTTVTMGNSVTSIGEKAFYCCINLTSINIPNSVKSIGKFAFTYCNITNITIPNGVTSIGETTFGACRNLTNITIPQSVTSIGYGAFQMCRSLTSITFNGTIAQWNAISKGNIWKNDVPATVVHCTNGDVAI